MVYYVKRQKIFVDYDKSLFLMLGGVNILMKKFFKDKKLIVAIILAELVLLVLNALRFNRSESYFFGQDDFMVKYFNLETNEYECESGFYADHSYREKSYVVTKPVRLKKGIYNVYVNYNSNSHLNWHSCYTTLQSCLDVSKNSSAHLVNSDRVSMVFDRNEVSYNSWVRYGTDFEVRMGPDTEAAGDGIFVLANEVRITYLRGKTIIYESTKLLLLFLVVDILMYLIFMKRDETKRFFEDKALTVAVLLFTVMVASYPLLSDKLYFGDDIFYHLRRIGYLGEGLKCGQFPVHIYPRWDRGYGYAAGVGYGDLLLYPSAILVALGFTFQAGYKFYIILTNILTALISYFSFGKIADDERIGLASSVLFTLFGFRLHSIYAGATVGEFGAFTFLPLVILGLWEIYEKKSKHAYIYLALGVTLTLSCHVLSTFILALVIPFLCLILFEKTIKKDVLIPLLKAVVAIVLLNLHFIVPLLDYMLSKNISGNSVTDMLWGRARDFVTFFSYAPDPSFDSTGFLGLGIFSIAIFALAFGFIVSGKFEGKGRIYARVYALNIVLILLSTNSMFYFVLYQDVPVLYKLFANMQFPWHFLDVSCGMTVFWFAVLMKETAHKLQKKTAAYGAMVVICLSCVMQSNVLLADVIIEANPITMFDDAEIYYVAIAEFSIPGIEESIPYTDTDMIIREDVDASAQITRRNGTTIYAQVDNPTENAVVTEAPLWGFKHYAAKAGGKKLKAFRADNKKLAVEIPAGYSGEIKIWFREPLFWRLSELISLAALVCIVAEYKKLRKKEV